MDIILITQYYNVNTNDSNYDNTRQKEIDYCLQQNANNNYIKEIHLLTERVYDLSTVITENIDKIKQIVIGKRLTYLDSFTYYSKNLLGKICILSNADIYFDCSLYILEHVNFNFDIFFCLNRYEVHSEQENYPPMLHGTEENHNINVPYLKPYEPSIWSQDVWIWKSSNMSRLLSEKYNFMLGISGCDNMIARLLYDDNYTIINPSRLIVCNHYDLLSTNITEAGLIKGCISSKKNNKIGTVNDYVFLDNIIDIPDKYTYNVYNNMLLDDMNNLITYNANRKRVTIKKNVEIITLDKIKINSDNYLELTNIYINLKKIEKILYIDIQGKHTNMNNSNLGYVKKFKIIYNKNGYNIEEEYDGICIPNSDYIKRIYFNNPIICSNMTLIIMEYENIPALRINFYKEKIIEEKTEYEMIELYDCMIQKSNEYIEYNFENLYDIEILEFDTNVQSDIKLEYMKDTKYETKILVNDNSNIIRFNIIKCTKLRVYYNKICKLYCKKIKRYNIYNDIIIKPHLNKLVYSTFADYEIYKLIYDDTRINSDSSVQNIMSYYHINSEIKDTYKTFDNYYNYVKNKTNINTNKYEKKEGISIFVCVMNRTYNIINNMKSWLKQTFNELIIIDWSSDENLYNLLLQFNDSRIKYVRIENESKYIRTFAHNICIKMCTYNKIFKLDADVVLCNNFFENHILNEGMFYVGDWMCVRNSNEKHLHGNIYLYFNDFVKINGYNEIITNYGWEDSDLTIRLLLLGLRKKLFNFDFMFHIPHSNSLRIINNNIKIHPDILTQSNKILIKNLPIWNENYTTQDYNVNKINDNYYILNRIKNDSFNIENIFTSTLKEHINTCTKIVFNWYKEKHNIIHEKYIEENNIDMMNSYLNNKHLDVKLYDYIICSNIMKIDNITIDDIFYLDQSNNLILNIIIYDIIDINNTIKCEDNYDLLFDIIYNKKNYINLYNTPTDNIKHNKINIIKKYGKYFFKKSVVFQYLFDLLDPLFHDNSEDLNINKIGNLFYLNCYWQEPVITEKQVFLNLHNINGNHNYHFISFPWATLIDDIYKYSKSKLLFIKNYNFMNAVTVCQHIYFRSLLPLFVKIGIKYIFTPHCELDDYLLEQEYNIKIIPFMLFPVKWNQHSIIENKKYMYSFEGAYNPEIYLTNIREKISLLPKSDNIYINVNNEFYYNKYIYDNTIEKHIIDTSDSYIMLLQNSKYTLCPSGTGVNSIRFFEALSYGSVPILLADTIKMIDYIDISWTDYIVVMDENDIYNIDIILEKEEVYYNKRKANCIELFNRWFHPDKMHVLIDKYFKYNMKQLTLNSINYYNIIKKNMKNNMNQYITNTNDINENDINEINIINKKIDMIQNLNELDKKKSYAFVYEHSDLKNPWIYNFWLYLLKENNFDLNKIYLIDNNNKMIAFLR